MNILLERAKRREELVRIAKDSNVSKLAELFLAKYRTDLEHLQDGDHIEDHVPVGKEKFTDWLKEQISSYFPTLSGLVENERTLKDYAGQVADAISKSNTGVQNPLRDYKISKDPIFVKAQTTPAKPSLPAPYLTPTEVFRTNEDREQIIPKDLEQGVQNQNSMNTMHPIKPFLSKEKEQELRILEKKNDGPYDVFRGNEHIISPSAPNNDPKTMEESKKEANLLSKLTRKAKDEICSKCGMKDCPCMKEGRECSCKPKKEATRKGKLIQASKKKLEELINEVHALSEAAGFEGDPDAETGLPLDRTYFDRNFDDEEEISYLEKPGPKTIIDVNETRYIFHAPLQDVIDAYQRVVDSFKKLSTAKGVTRKIAQQLFGPTTMSTRQCPDHPGQQTTRLADGLRQCPLDGKTYDFVRGFTTENGTKHNGGTVQAQGAIPPGSVIVRLDKKASFSEEDEERLWLKFTERVAFELNVFQKMYYNLPNPPGSFKEWMTELLRDIEDNRKSKLANQAKQIKTAMDTPKTHAFLYQVLQEVPAESRSRSILNYKFQHNLSLEEAIAKFEEAERLAAQQQAQPKG